MAAKPLYAFICEPMICEYWNHRISKRSNWIDQVLSRLNRQFGFESNNKSIFIGSSILWAEILWCKIWTWKFTLKKRHYYCRHPG